VYKLSHPYKTTGKIIILCNVTQGFRLGQNTVLW
jgi:hypothetical protein